MFIKKSNSNNWFMIGSALISGFLLGIAYKKHKKYLKKGIKNLTMKNPLDFDCGYTTSQEPDA